MTNFLRSWLIPVTFVLLALSARGQSYFNTRYTLGPTYSLALTVLPAAGNYWIGGILGPSGPNGQAFYLQQLDAQGAPNSPLKQWAAPNQQPYPGVSGSLFHAGGGLAVAGSTGYPVATAPGGHLTDGHLWHFTAAGDTLWTRRYKSVAPGGAIIFRNGRELPDGGFILVGEHYVIDSANPSFFRADCMLLRTDRLGHERWRRSYDVRRYEICTYLTLAADGGYLLSGFGWDQENGAGPIDLDGTVVRTDSLGQEQWRTRLGNRAYAANDLVEPTVALAGGGWLVGGVWADSVAGSEVYNRATLYWLDSAGQLVRRRSYGQATLSTESYALHTLADGGYLLAGQLRDTAQAVRGFLLRVCTDGDSVWWRSIHKMRGPNSKNYLRDVQPTADGGFVGAGFLTAQPPDTGPQATWVFKVDEYGYLQAGGAPPTMQCRPNGLPEEEARGGGLDVWPNPSADGHFTLRQAQAGATVLTVTDALGRVVWRQTKTAAAETVVDLSASAAGVYVLRTMDEKGRQHTYKLLRQ